MTFYGTVAFVLAFAGARLFAVMNPTVVVIRGTIHFHHFWYGLAMVVAAGWMGIVINEPRFGRNLAIVFGLGAGLIGDEVGLLLTFGDYYSSLTEVFFVGAIGFVILISLLARGRGRIQKEVFDVSRQERLTQIGIFVSAFSAVFFAVGSWEIGLTVLGFGLLVFLWSRDRRQKMVSHSPHL